MLRGGSFNNNAHNVRSAYRNNNNPDNRNNNIGFRVASTLRQTHSFVMPESTGQILARLPCEACLVQSPGRCPVSGGGNFVRPNKKPARQVW